MYAPNIGALEDTRKITYRSEGEIGSKYNKRTLTPHFQQCINYQGRRSLRECWT